MVDQTKGSLSHSRTPEAQKTVKTFAMQALFGRQVKAAV